MNKQHIPFRDTGRFSSLICDYLSENNTLKPFYGLFPTLNNFKTQITDKTKSYSATYRNVLVQSLREQYEIITPSSLVLENLDLLAQKNTFTITTGHQLSLMTGPLYFIYIIISTINLCEQLKVKYPSSNFVPVYWMASEDHDFEEISSFRFQDKRINWHHDSAGAVGEIPLDDLQEVLDVFEQYIGTSVNSNTIRKWITESYRASHNLSEATFRLVNQLFGDKGLIILEPNIPALKKLFIPILKAELTSQHSFKNVNSQVENIQKTYSASFIPQVNPRRLNLFYLAKNNRYRIEKEAGEFSLNGTEERFSEASFLKILEIHPEYFSPNVILRPVYQEVILPNLCYIGGGGEIAYWFQLKKHFDFLKIPFPVLLLRNSAVIYSKKTAKKITNLDLNVSDFFLKRSIIINKKIREVSDIDLDLSFLKTQLNKQFDYLNKLVAKTDKSFEGAVTAQNIKQLKGISNLEKRLLKAQKKMLADKVNRLVDLHEQLFPDHTLQERTINFVSLYLKIGDAFLPTLFEALDPMNPNFVLLEY